MGAVDFGLKLLKLHAGADRRGLGLDKALHNKPYAGRRIPASVTISVTYRCNLKCAHCQSEKSAGRKELDTGRLLGLIDEIADAGAAKIGFTGGEPLVRTDMRDVLARCRERGLVVSLVSNGVLVPKNIDALKSVHLLMLSLDGGPDAHDRIRGRGSFGKVLEAARAAQAAGIPTAALTSLMSHNVSDLEDMAAVTSEFKMHWLVGMIQTGFTKKSDQDLSAEQIRGAVGFLRKAGNLRTTPAYLDFAEKGRPMTRCFAGVGYCVVSPDGLLFPCFPAQFDRPEYVPVAPGCGERKTPPNAYRGVSIVDKSFEKAFSGLPLYRSSCGSCALACHAEANFLYDFSPASILSSFRMMRPA